MSHNRFEDVAVSTGARWLGAILYRGTCVKAASLPGKRSSSAAFVTVSEYRPHTTQR